MTSSNIRLNPYKYGVSMAKAGIEYYPPYQNRERNEEYKKGYYDQKEGRVKDVS